MLHAPSGWYNAEHWKPAAPLGDDAGRGALQRRRATRQDIALVKTTRTGSVGNLLAVAVQDQQQVCAFLVNPLQRLVQIRKARAAREQPVEVPLQAAETFAA